MIIFKPTVSKSVKHTQCTSSKISRLFVFSQSLDVHCIILCLNYVTLLRFYGYLKRLKLDDSECRNYSMIISTLN